MLIKGTTARRRHLLIFAGLKKTGAAIVDKARADNLFLLSSSVAFHCFLSFIPIISVLVGIYLFLNFRLDWEHFELAKEMMPAEVYAFAQRQVSRVNANMKAVNVATSVSLLLSLWLSNNTTRAFSQSLNVVFDAKPRERLILGLGASLLQTLFMFFCVIFFLFALAAAPIAFAALSITLETRSALIVLQWLLFSSFMVLGLCMAYKFLPAHEEKLPLARFLPGSIVATAFGCLLALFFSFYVSSYGVHNRIYGALGAVVVFMLWLRLTFSCILFGGEVNYFFIRDPALLGKILPWRSR